MSDAKDKHIISILLDNEAGALSRVAGLFSARGYNIEALTVAETDNPSLSRMTIVTLGGDKLIHQIVSQLNKLIDVVDVRDLSRDELVEREILLAKVRYSDEETELAGLRDLIERHGASIVECGKQVCLFELAAPSRRIEALIQDLNGWRMVEVVRSGVVSLGGCGAVALKG